MILTGGSFFKTFDMPAMKMHGGRTFPEEAVGPQPETISLSSLALRTALPKASLLK